MTAAIIIARGGSKRLPRKNVRPFCGLPLVAWTVIQAKCSQLVDWVFLSTDDDEIEDIGRQYGAEIIRRPNWEDADQIAANRVYQHAIDVVEERGYDMDSFASMFPTSPLRFPDDVDKGYEHYLKTGCHVIPLGRRRETTIYYDCGGLVAKLVFWDKQQRYLDCNSGLFNVVKTSWYKWYSVKYQEYVGGDHDADFDVFIEDTKDHPDSDNHFVECEPFQCVETDTLMEFEHAELLMEHFILKGRGPDLYYDYARGI